MKKILVVLSVIAIAAFMTGVASAQIKAPDTLILKGSPMGAVKFPHAVHSKMAGTTCQTCHHASKTEHPAKVAEQACRDCHTKPATAPMKTATQAAFHNPMAKSGLCIDCHLKQTPDKKAPTKCADCHKKENV
jgi:sRNA-binding protein